MAQQNRKAVLTAQLRSIASELARLESRPAEPAGAFPVVSFSMQHSEGGAVYTYAARAALGRWYVTGSANHVPNGRTWDHLLDWIDENSTRGIEGSNLVEMTPLRALVPGPAASEPEPEPRHIRSDPYAT
jgi:hypothetical protein